MGDTILFSRVHQLVGLAELNMSLPSSSISTPSRSRDTCPESILIPSRQISLVASMSAVETLGSTTTCDHESQEHSRARGTQCRSYDFNQRLRCSVVSPLFICRLTLGIRVPLPGRFLGSPGSGVSPCSLGPQALGGVVSCRRRYNGDGY